MIRLDIKYARELSFWLDLKIILKTIPALIGQMRDIRKKQKNLSRPVPAKTAVAVPAANLYSMPPYHTRCWYCHQDLYYSPQHLILPYYYNQRSALLLQLGDRIQGL